jgi:hypothetical protein
MADEPRLDGGRPTDGEVDPIFRELMRIFRDKARHPLMSNDRCSCQAIYRRRRVRRRIIGCLQLNSRRYADLTCLHERLLLFSS